MAVDIDEPALLRALGEAITARREELGLSQRALGLEAGVERNMLRGWKTDRAARQSSLWHVSPKR